MLKETLRMSSYPLPARGRYSPYLKGRAPCGVIYTIYTK